MRHLCVMNDAIGDAFADALADLKLSWIYMLYVSKQGMKLVLFEGIPMGYKLNN